jgi:hypothetical protein
MKANENDVLCTLKATTCVAKQRERPRASLKHAGLSLPQAGLNGLL